jgi:hypothetical protein
MQTVSDSFIRLVEHIESKKKDLVRLLLHIERVRLECSTPPMVKTEFDRYAKQERDLTQEIDLNAEPTKEEMTALLIDRHQVMLKRLSLEELADMAALSDEISN